MGGLTVNRHFMPSNEEYPVVSRPHYTIFATVYCEVKKFSYGFSYFVFSYGIIVLSQKFNSLSCATSKIGGKVPTFYHFLNEDFVILNQKK